DRDLRVAITSPIDLMKVSGPGDVDIGPLFQDGDRSLARPPPSNRLAKRAFSEALAVRRVAEDELEGLKRAGLAEPRRRAAPVLGAARACTRCAIPPHP